MATAVSYSSQALLTKNTPKVIIKKPVTSSSAGDSFPSYDTVFNDAPEFDYFELDVSQINYIPNQAAWFGFTKFHTKEHLSVELLVIIGGWQGKRSVISYRIQANDCGFCDCGFCDCGYCVDQKHHSVSELNGYRQGS